MFSAYYLKKWIKMVTGHSLLHVPQKCGLFFDKQHIAGYYNDLRQKVYRDKKTGFGCFPKDDRTGQEATFPTQIFQYGIGSYDCYLETKDDRYLLSFRKAADWAVEKQQKDGGWFSFPEFDDHYGSMVQGEGISLLARAYLQYRNEEYLRCADKAYFFMNEHCSGDIKGNFVYFEFVGRPAVLNGWIFSIFGLYDYYLLTRKPDVFELWLKAIASINRMLPLFDSGKWSYYDLKKNYVSGFYMRLHIAQLEALYRLTDNKIFGDYAERWRTFLNDPLKRLVYFIKKALQKIRE